MEVGKGAGLGLSVCIGIVKSHDGDITVQRDGEGKGTTVTIMLPVEKRGGMKKSENSSQRYHILVIDDEADLCSLFQDILEDEGHSVTTAQDGLEGLARYGERKPDVIILDLKMPRMGGMETLRNIRKVDKDVIVIILTAYGSAFTAREAADLNVYEYISKPFNIETVKRVVSEALASGSKGEQ